LRRLLNEELCILCSSPDTVLFSMNEMGWTCCTYGGQERLLLKMVCYTCGLTTLETSYCSFSPLSCFSNVHFVLICTVVVLYCFVMCVCVRVCVCVGFVMCVSVCVCVYAWVL